MWFGWFENSKVVEWKNWKNLVFSIGFREMHLLEKFFLIRILSGVGKFSNNMYFNWRVNSLEAEAV